MKHITGTQAYVGRVSICSTQKCNLQCNCNVLYDSMTLKCTVIVISFKWLNICRHRTPQSRTVDGRPKAQEVSSLLLTAGDRVWHRDWLYFEYSSLPPTASFHQCCNIRSWPPLYNLGNLRRR
jgi:hypothetical protein